MQERRCGFGHVVATFFRTTWIAHHAQHVTK